MVSDINVRHAALSDCRGIARVHVDSWRTTYLGIVPQSYMDQLSYDVRESRWRNILSHSKETECNFVAADPVHGIVGFAGGGPERDASSEYDSELYAVYLLPEFQRRGVGKRLMKAVVDDLMRHGWRSMRVWVLSANPACGFYERLGGKVVAEREIELGGARLPELAYGWTNLNGFAWP
jgi:ribosomal protein S18 acetylase RimI-like enzyme